LIAREIKPGQVLLDRRKGILLGPARKGLHVGLDAGQGGIPIVLGT